MNTPCDPDSPRKKKKQKWKRITILIPEEEKDAFEAWCDRKDGKMSIVLRGWIANREMIGLWSKGGNRWE